MLHRYFRILAPADRGRIRPLRRTSQLTMSFKEFQTRRPAAPQPLDGGRGDFAPMSTKRNRVPELQRQLLMAGIRHPTGRLRFAKGSAETLATTYAALLSLQRKKLIEPEKPVDPSMMTWKVTKAGKAAVAEKPTRR